MTGREHFRDEALGAALRELDVPEHRPDFDRGLDTRLARRRRDWRLPLGALAGAAVVSAVVLLLVGLPGTGPGKALAAQVRAKVAAALAGATNIRGTLVYGSLDPRTRRVSTIRVRFAMTGRGDLRLKTLHGPDVAVYDAGRGVERGLSRSASLGGGPVFAYERTGVAPGPPDGGPSDLFLQRQLGSALRALLVSGGAAHARKTTSLGRPVWEVVLRVRPNRLFADEDRLELTIDRETGFPLRVKATLRGAFRSELQVRGLRIDTSLPPDEFSLAFPRGRKVLRTDDGFRRLSLVAVRAQVGYAPLVPDTLPHGYRAAQTAVARRRGIVSLSYRRGFDQLIVTSRPRGARGRDPFAEAGLARRGRAVPIDAGALRGATAHVVLEARSIPHLWVASGKLVVTVAGDANEFELVQIARSLVPYRSSAVSPCRTSDLQASAGLQGATGSLIGAVTIENVGRTACTVEGRPRISVLAGGRPLSVHELPKPPSWDGQLVPAGYPRLLVTPRGRVEARVFWSNWCGRATGSLTVLVDLPHRAGSLTTPLAAGTPSCDNPQTPSTLRVEPFIPVF